MLTWCFFVLFVFRETATVFALKRTSLGSVLDCVDLRNSGRVSLSTNVDVSFKNDSEKVYNLLTWFSHGSGTILAPEPLGRVPLSTTRVFGTLFL